MNILKGYICKFNEFVIVENIGFCKRLKSALKSRQKKIHSINVFSLTFVYVRENLQEASATFTNKKYLS